MRTNCRDALCAFQDDRTAVVQQSRGSEKEGQKCEQVGFQRAQLTIPTLPGPEQCPVAAKPEPVPASAPPPAGEGVPPEARRFHPTSIQWNKIRRNCAILEGNWVVVVVKGWTSYEYDNDTVEEAEK